MAQYIILKIFSILALTAGCTGKNLMKEAVEYKEEKDLVKRGSVLPQRTETFSQTWEWEAK